MKLPHLLFGARAAYDLKGHLAHVKDLHAKYELNNRAKCDEWTFTTLDIICEKKIPHQIIKPMHDAVHALYENDDIYRYQAPTLEDRDYLTREQHRLSDNRINSAAQAIAGLFSELLGHLPESVFIEGKQKGLKVPLSAGTRAYKEVVHAICTIFLTSKYGDHLTFPRLYDQIVRTMHNLSGMDIDKPSTRKLVTPLEYVGDPSDYLRGTPFDDFFNTQVSFVIPETVRNEHFLFIGRTGSGKTQFIQRDILDNLQRSNSPAMLVIDSQNQMIPRLERLACAKDRIVIIDPFDSSPAALNMFITPERSRDYDPNLKEAIEANTLQQFAWIFSALDQELTGRQTTLFAFTSRILLTMRANMQTLLDFMRIEKPAELKASKFWPYIEQSDEQTRYFFDNRFCTSDYNKTKGGVADRLLGVLRVPAFNRMFMAPDNRLDLYTELANRKLIVFNTQKSRLGNDASAILGRYAISLYIRAAFERELDKDPPPALLYVDEASEYFGKKDSSDTLFTQLRKYNAGTAVFFQDLSQLGEQHQTLIANTTTKLTGGLSIADARKLAPDMRTSEQDLMSIQKATGSFQVMCYVNNITDSAIKLTFAYGAVENAAQLTNDEHAALRASNREKLGTAGATIPSAPSVPHSHISLPVTGGQSMPSPQSPVADTPTDRTEPLIKPGKDW